MHCADTVCFTLIVCHIVQVRSRASSVSSHSNPLFTTDPDDLDAQADIQSAALPTVPESPEPKVAR